MACMPRARVKDSWPSVPSTPFWTSTCPYPSTTSSSMTVCRFPALEAPKYRQCLGSRAQYLFQSGTIRGPCSSERITVTGTPFNTKDDKCHTSLRSFPNPLLCVWPASFLTPPWMCFPANCQAAATASGGKARRRFSLKAAICGRLGIYSVLPSVVCSHVERQEGVHDRQVKRPSELGGV